MKHIGTRPQHLPLEIDEKKKRKTYYENFPDGGYRIWDNRSLNSGCGRVLTEIKEDDNLIYCSYCKTWNNKNQFEGVNHEGTDSSNS